MLTNGGKEIDVEIDFLVCLLTNGKPNWNWSYTLLDFGQLCLFLFLGMKRNDNFDFFYLFLHFRGNEWSRTFFSQATKDSEIFHFWRAMLWILLI